MAKKGARQQAESTSSGGKRKVKSKKTITGVKLILPTFILLAIGICAQLLFRILPTAFFEGPYSYVSEIFSTVLGFLPSLLFVSVTEFAVLILVIVLITVLVITIKHIFQKCFRFRSIITFFCIVLFIASIVLNMFNLAWGGNYYRKPLSAILGYDNYNGINYMEKEYSSVHLHGLCLSLRKTANTLAAQVNRDENGCFSIECNDDYFKKIADSCTSLKDINSSGRRVRPAKEVFFSPVMSIFGVLGMYMPLFAEANVNTAQPPLLVFATAAHENAHALGFAREDEASFAGYLACMNVDDVNIRYSGTMYALIYASSALKQYDKANNTSIYSDLVQGYSEQVSNDINQYNKYWSDRTTFISSISGKVNDTYLKANGVKSGVNNYGEFVQYLLVYSDINRGIADINSGDMPSNGAPDVNGSDMSDVNGSDMSDVNGSDMPDVNGSDMSDVNGSGDS